MPRWQRLPLLLYAIIIAVVALTIYLMGSIGLLMTAMAPRLPWSAGALQLVVLSGGMTLVAGVLAVVDVVVLLPAKRKRPDVMVNPPPVRDLTVVLTAYNDEASIGLVVDDFRSHPLVRRVIVVDNDSTDGTADVAARHGAVVVRETQRGYGRCVYRALREGLNSGDTDLTLLCEGDATFRAFDIERDWWSQHYAEFVPLYPNEFVAVVDGDVVAHAPNLTALESEMASKGYPFRGDRTWVRFIDPDLGRWLL